MNDDKKESLIWWVMMLILVGVIVVLQYRDTPKWTEAIKPVLVIAVLIYLARAIIEFSYAAFGWRQLSISSFIGLGVPLLCLALLWFLDSSLKGLFAIVFISFWFAIVMMLANWFKGRK